MPELPDVEVFRRYVQRTSVGRPIARVAFGPHRPVIPVVEIRRGLEGARFSGTGRHGKWMFAHASTGGALALHFGMTGRVEHLPGGREEPPHARLRVVFRDGSRLVYADMRRFGRIAWARDVEEFVRERDLGPDALAVGESEFLRRLERRRGGVKAALMDQTLLAGLGNLWVDELLFQVGVAPRRTIPRIGPAKRREMHRTMRRVLRRAIDTGVDFDRLPRSYLLPSREPGGRCPRDGARLRSATVAGRTTYWCPRHQH